MNVDPQGGRIKSWQGNSQAGALSVLNNDEGSMGCFVMVPFASRLKDGLFVWNGQEIVLSANVEGERYPIHGWGWQADWRVISKHEAGCTLGWDHNEVNSSLSGWPWAFSATLELKLLELGLQVELDIVNRSDATMPAGLGIHPYFRKTPKSSIVVDVERRWHLDAYGMPIINEPQFFDGFADPQALAGLSMDDAFSGWDGQAEIHWPEWSTKLVMTANTQHLVVYAPPGQNYVCLEPVTNIPNAFNLPRGPFHTLAPGERHKLTVRMGLLNLSQ